MNRQRTVWQTVKYTRGSSHKDSFRRIMSSIKVREKKMSSIKFVTEIVSTDLPKFQGVTFLSTANFV
jgi:hypothetical protein